MSRHHRRWWSFSRDWDMSTKVALIAALIAAGVCCGLIGWAALETNYPLP